MPKRFTDTEKWKKSLLKSMPASYKLLWLYICDDCDHAGIWQVDFEVACIRIGEDITEDEAIKVFGNKITVFDDGHKWFIPGFIDFQYGELNPKINAHASVIRLLKKYGMCVNAEKNNEPLMNPSRRVQYRDQDKYKDKDKDNSIAAEEINSDPIGIVPELLLDFVEKSPSYFVDRDADYPALMWIANAIGKNLGFKKADVTTVGKEDIRTRWGEILEFIATDKWFSTRSISDLKKQWQSVIQSFEKNRLIKSPARTKNSYI